MRNKKILIVLKYASFYSYCESIIKELEKENDLTLCIQQENKINSIKYCIDARLNLLFQKNINNDEILNLVDESRNIKIVEGINRKGRWVKIIRNIRETLNYLSFLLRGDRNTFSKLQSKYISNKIIKLIKLIKFRPLLKVLFSLLKLINNIIPTDKGINSFIKNIDPDIVLIVGAN